MINPPLVDPTQTEPAYPPQVPAAYAPPPQQLPPGGYYAPSQPTTSTTAIVSLIGGILAWTVLPLIGMVVALIAGHMARNEIRRAGGQLGGDGLAIAGLILGYAQLVITVIGCCAIIAIGGLTLLGASAGT
jgi:quinol-cytochrome oxidoreductase complex cytochrome b subunit